MQDIKCEELQGFLDRIAAKYSLSSVDHLRFRLLSVFKFAMSEGVVDRNPADALYTPRNCKESGERRFFNKRTFCRCFRCFRCASRSSFVWQRCRACDPARSWP